MTCSRALVTGCSTGIGLRTAITLATAGYQVYAGMRYPKDADRLLAASDRADVLVEVVNLDVTDSQMVTSVTAAVDPELLVNNAGIGMSGSVERLPDVDLRAVFETNLFGPLALMRAVLPRMRARRRGVIVNIGSVDAVLPGRPINWSYAASKHALGVTSEGLALEVEPFGIRVRQLDPGFFATSILEHRRSRRSAPVDAAGPYQAMLSATETAVADGMACAADPQLVADAVLAAALDPAVFPVRRLVGADAVAAVTELAGLDEETAAAKWRNAVGLTDGRDGR